MPTDLYQRAKAIVDFATSDEPGDEKDEARAAGGRKGAASQGCNSGHDRGDRTAPVVAHADRRTARLIDRRLPPTQRGRAK